MPSNSIKYSAGSESNALNKGNWWIGTGDVSKGPTSVTGFYNGITPPDNGYTVYLDKASGGPSIYACSSDPELVALTNIIAGTSYSTVNECLIYFDGQNDKICFNRDYESVVTEGLLINLDAGFTPSYPRSGNTWSSIIGPTTANLINGPSFNTSGYISFDGVNDYATFTNEYSFWTGNGTDYTFELWFKMRTLPTAEYGANGHIWGGENGNDVVMYLAPVSGGVSKGIMVYDDTRYSAPGMQTTGGFSANTWAQWVITGDGTNNTVTHYINGALDKLNGAVTPSSQYVKSWSGTRFAFDSRWGTYSTLDLAIARQYNRALTAQEVLQNFNAQKARFGL